MFSYCSFIMYSFDCFALIILFPLKLVLLNYCLALLLGHDQNAQRALLRREQKRPNFRTKKKKRKRKNHTNRYNRTCFQLGDLTVFLRKLRKRQRLTITYQNLNLISITIQSTIFLRSWNFFSV